MSFQKIFTCDNKKCNKEGIQLVPIQIRSDKKNNAVKVMARCPKCQKGYWFDLPLNDTDEWDPLLRANVFRCAHCGKANVKVVNSSGHPHRDYKIRVVCQSCHEQEERNVDGNLYYLVEDNVPANVTTTTEVTCPTCQAQISETDATCPNCGKELHCASCGSLLPETAHFCLKCGASVTGDAVIRFLKDPSSVSSAGTKSLAQVVATLSRPAPCSATIAAKRSSRAREGTVQVRAFYSFIRVTSKWIILTSEVDITRMLISND
jgi:predicted RNA-binding Zn-ribbon protein involved in translation (DUF1610 family)